MSEDAESSQLTQDQQEASSIRYACGLRLALLSSGNWACWFEGELQIWSQLDEPRLREFAQAETAARELWWSGAAERRARLLAEDASSVARTPVQQAGRDIEEMGL